MSKKVLNYAGRRPMLLALIMATLTLGLLFSGWFTPTPGRAQAGGGNPSSNNENTNCPNYTTNVVPSCPSIINHGSITPLSFCVNQGDSLPDPTYTPGTATAGGNVVTTITETCSNTVTASTNPVNYSFSWYYKPKKPKGKLAPGIYSRPAIEYCASSDTNDCSSPGEYTMGTVIWTVIDTNQYPQWTFAANGGILTAFKQLMNLFGTGDGESKTTVSGEISGTQSKKCCDATPTDVYDIEGGIKLALTNDNHSMLLAGFPPGFPFLVNVTLNEKDDTTISFKISGENGGCSGDTSDICGKITAGLDVTGTLAVTILSPKLLSFSGGFEAQPSASGTACFNKNGVDLKKCGVSFTLAGVQAVGTLVFLGSETQVSYPIPGAQGTWGPYF
jgi:hypothetical protein